MKSFTLYNEPLLYQVGVHFSNFVMSHGIETTFELYRQATHKAFNYQVWPIYGQEDKALIAMANIVNTYGKAKINEYIALVYQKKVA